MATSLLGLIDWNLTRDKEGHRTYKSVYKIQTTDTSDGPGTIFGTAGLPVIGASWALGNDSDTWARCWPNAVVKPMITVEKGRFWTAEFTHSTKPLERCQDNTIEDPVLEPAKISGTFVKFITEATTDRNGDPLTNSAFEQLRGPSVEVDDNRPTVRISMNITSLPLTSFATLVDTVNDSTMWGLSARKVKLSNVSWERKLYGTCSYYYTVVYDFDINFNTFDRTILDEGTKYLAPGGTSTNPDHYIVYKDKRGENSRVILDGSGGKWDGTGSPGTIGPIEIYDQGNLLSLGVPDPLT